MRSGSSRNDTSGESGVRRRRAARSTAPSNGSTSCGSGRRSAIAFTVKSRRERSVSRSSAKATPGLRESGRYTSARNVVTSNSTPSISAPTVPNCLPWSHTLSVSPPQHLLDLVGAGVGGDVDVGRPPIEEGVADAPADQVALVPGRDEAVRERTDGRSLVEQRPQPRRDGGHGVILAGGGHPHA